MDKLAQKIAHQWLASKTAAIRLPTKDGTRTTFSVDDVHVHVWFDAGVAKTDYGQHVPDSGEWQVIASTSPDPLNQRPRGRELARETFRFADPRQRNAVYASAQQYVKRLLFKFRSASVADKKGELRIPEGSWRKFIQTVPHLINSSDGMNGTGAKAMDEAITYLRTSARANPALAAQHQMGRILKMLGVLRDGFEERDRVRDRQQAAWKNIKDDMATLP